MPEHADRLAALRSQTDRLNNVGHQIIEPEGSQGRGVDRRIVEGFDFRGGRRKLRQIAPCRECSRLPTGIRNRSGRASVAASPLPTRFAVSQARDEMAGTRQRPDEPHGNPAAKRGLKVEYEFERFQ